MSSLDQFILLTCTSPCVQHMTAHCSTDSSPLQRSQQTSHSQAHSIAHRATKRGSGSGLVPATGRLGGSYLRDRVWQQWQLLKGHLTFSSSFIRTDSRRRSSEPTVGSSDLLTACFVVFTRERVFRHRVREWRQKRLQSMAATAPSWGPVQSMTSARSSERHLELVALKDLNGTVGNLARLGRMQQEVR